MRAVLVSEFGGPEQLRLAEAADPVAGPGQVRIAVHAAGTNPVDAGNRADGSWAGLHVPCILGYDVAGVIDSVGSGVSSLAPGDRVMAMTHFPDGAGGYAELVVVEGRPGRADQPGHLVPRGGRHAPGGRHRGGGAVPARPAGHAGCSSWGPAAVSGCSCCNWPRRRGS